MGAYYWLTQSVVKIGSMLAERVKNKEEKIKASTDKLAVNVGDTLDLKFRFLTILHSSYLYQLTTLVAASAKEYRSKEKNE